MIARLRWGTLTPSPNQDTTTIQESAIPDSIRMLPGGDRGDGVPGETGVVQNPAGWSNFPHIPRAGVRDIDRVGTAAAGAFANWRDILPNDRSPMLPRTTDAVGTREGGGNHMPYRYRNPQCAMRPEAWLTADIFRCFGGLAMV